MKIRKEYTIIFENEVLCEGIKSLTHLYRIITNIVCNSLNDKIEIDEFIYKPKLAFNHDRSSDDVKLVEIYDLVDIKKFFDGILEDCLKKIGDLLWKIK